MLKNKLIYFNNVVYGLGKDYGFRVDLYRPTETTDLHTGKKTVTRTKYPIKLAIVFPNQLFRDFSYITTLLSQRNDQFGGIIDTSQRRILINKKYLPRHFKIETTDYIIFNHDRLEIQKIDEMELANYWQVLAKKIEGQVTNEIQDRRIKTRIDFTQTITYDND